MYINEDFSHLKGPEVITEMEIDTNDEFSHSMVLVGYDDSKKAFNIMNSWGTEWRNNGYCWIEYDLFSRITNEIWVIRDNESFDTVIVNVSKLANNAIPIFDEIYSDMMITDVSIGVLDPDFPDDGEMIKFIGYVNIDSSWVKTRVRLYYSYITILVKANTMNRCFVIGKITQLWKMI